MLGATVSRAFISLYLLIVLSALIVGWGLDRLWERYESTSSPQPMQLLNIQEMSGAETLAKLNAGEFVSVVDDQGRSYIYQKIDNQPYVLVMEKSKPPSPWLELVLATLFYIAIGIAIFFWLWPLSRDLSKLEKYAQTLGTNNLEQRLTFAPQSTVYRLANAFNHMADRISDLLNTQKEMTNAVSHELKTPLARMKFALQMASDNDNIALIKPRLQSINRDVNEMDQLVNQLLGFAKFEQSQPVLEWKQGDMQLMVKSIVSRLTSDIDGETSIANVHVTAVDSATDYCCDWPLMERAVLNLIQNAIKHCCDRVDITLQKNSERFQVIVDDDGLGIPEQSRQKIFQSFVRLRVVDQEQSSGFGVGLAIVQRVATWHQGSAYATQSPLNGARFVIEWPIQ